MGRKKGSKNKQLEETLNVPIPSQEEIDKNLINKAELEGNKEKYLKEESLPVNEPKEKVNINPKLTKEQEERKAKLKNVMRDINKDKGLNLKFGSDVPTKERISFGYKCLDKLTGGGIQRGTYTTIWGSKGVGKSTIAYKAIATAQKEGLITCYIDMERSYDSNWAKSFGVDIGNLVYIATKEAEETLDVIIKLCKENAVDLIVLDSLHGMSPHQEQYQGKADKEKSIQDDTMALLARKLSQFFRMATPHVADAKVAVLLIGQSRLDLGSFVKCEVLSGGHALAHNSRLILRFRRGQKADGEFETIETEELDTNGKKKKEKHQTGFSLVIRVEKSQISGCTEGNEVATIFNYKTGIKDEE